MDPDVMNQGGFSSSFARSIVKFEKELTAQLTRKENFDDFKTCDIKLTLPSGATLHLHKAVLMQNPYFKSLFEFHLDGLKEYKSEELEEAGFTTLIKYLYTGELTITGENYLSIALLANKYQFSILPVICHQHLLD